MSSRDSFSDEPVTAGNRPRVLVVDDDDEARKAIAIALRKDGYDVVERRMSHDTSDLFGEHVRAPDAVVSAGVDLLVDLRERGWETPMILMASEGERLRAESIRHAPDAIFDKPLDADALRQVMLNVLWPRRTLAST